MPISSSLVPEDPAEAALHRSVRRKIVWRVVPLLASAYFLASLERANLGIASLSMNKSLGLTEAAFGLAAGLFFIGYFAFEVPSNMALARFGARTWLARIAVTWGVVATATALVQNAENLYVMRILLGIAEAGLFPGVVFYFTLWLPSRDRAQMLAWFAAGGALSGIVGPPLSGAILTFWPHGLFGLEDWRALFVIEGTPSIIIGILIWKLLVDNPGRARWLSAAEKAWLAVQLKESSGKSAHRNPLHALLDPRLLVLSISYFAKNCGGYVLVFFMPQIIKTLTAQNGSQLSTMTISLLSAVPAVFGTIAAILWAADSDQRQERRWHSALPLTLSALGIIWAASTTDPVMLLIALTLATIGISAMSGAFFQIPAGFLAGPAAAVGVAAINATGNLGGFVGPYLFGLLQGTTNSFFAGNVSLAIVLLIGAALIFLPMFRSRPALSGPEAVQPAGAPAATVDVERVPHMRGVGALAPAHALVTDSEEAT